MPPTPPPSTKSPASPGAASTGALQAQMRGRIQQTLKACTGPSFQERIDERARAFRKEAEATRSAQTRIIEEALQRAKARPSGSAVRDKTLDPPSVEERSAHHARTIKENNARYAREHAERRQRMQNREPLYRVSEVNAAKEEQKKRQKEYRRQLQEEEERRWAHIQELKEKVVERPLLVENYERPVHAKSVPNMRLIPNHTKDTPLQAKVLNSIEQNWFKDSAWGKEVSAIRDRQNNRQKLHEISYPPKKFVEKPVGPRILAPIDTRMHEQICQPWFQKSQWAAQVKEIRQRQDDRPKLHEISYPPKH